MSLFQLKSEYDPAGDQIKAIAELKQGLQKGEKFQTLQGVTGSGKTFTLANVIKDWNAPVLILSHNKTLAAQLYSEFKTFFPDNAVEYFISYYDYYLPESYIPQTDTYIAKDASVNENIEKLRLSATASLLERRDVIVVASVSCIYGLGSPDDYTDMCAVLEVGETIERNDFLQRLVEIQYARNDTAPEKGQFRVRGDCVDVFSPQKDDFIRVEFWGDSVEALTRHNLVTENVTHSMEKTVFFPCKHFVLPQERIESAVESIKKEMIGCVKQFEKDGRLVEAQRIYQRVNYDMEMLQEIGYCSGVENYSRYLSHRFPGQRSYCLFDFFPKNFLMVIDESHVTVPQVGAMYKADRSRKETLVDHGFRLPSALDNRPLKFNEFEEMLNQTVFVSATPGKYEDEVESPVVEQIIRPTGLLDPVIEIRPLDGQIDDVIAEVNEYAKRNERVIITTLTKKSAERLAEYFQELEIKAKYLHSELDALERVKILSELRRGDFDCLIGINLLREGIDLPEVSLITILDADKEGFLRSERSLIQIAGRAARNENGKVILYANKQTDSIKRLLTISQYRREKQQKYNLEHNITPRTVKSAIKETIADIVGGGLKDKANILEVGGKQIKLKTSQSKDSVEFVDANIDFDDLIIELEKEMLEAAENLEFERAAELRDKIKELSVGKI
ncbi:excinuclease ABC subunit UvrB [Lentisphaerota bacterium WC36G]|nr:excinuclease ABC subunit UvrB [Lentisphaerae bacterium WC36]